MNRECSCFVIGVPQIFEELNSVPRQEKGWEPLRYSLQNGETGTGLVGIYSSEMKKTVDTPCECFYCFFLGKWKLQLYDLQMNNSFQPYLKGNKPKGTKQTNIIYQSTDPFMAIFGATSTK